VLLSTFADTLAKCLDRVRIPVEITTAARIDIVHNTRIVGTITSTHDHDLTWNWNLHADTLIKVGWVKLVLHDDVTYFLTETIKCIRDTFVEVNDIHHDDNIDDAGSSMEEDDDDDDDEVRSKVSRDE
jgi:hypothetical protein